MLPGFLKVGGVEGLQRGTEPRSNTCPLKKLRKFVEISFWQKTCLQKKAWKNDERGKQGFLLTLSRKRVSKILRTSVTGCFQTQALGLNYGLGRTK